jgi:hypothetical protein
MSVESARSFYKDVSSGKVEVEASIMTGGDKASIKTYVQSLGYDFTDDELREALRENEVTMSMEEAEAIAGGKHGARDAESVVAAMTGAMAAACV